MLEPTLKYVEGFKFLEEEDEFYMQYFLDEDRNGKSIVGPPNSVDWDKCITFYRFLRVFYEATLRFSTSLFITSNAYFHEVCAIRGKLIKWCSSDKSVLQDMVVRMKLKFDKYWGNIEKQNMLLYVAVILDPRYKLKFVLMCLNKLYTEKEVDVMISCVKDCLSKLVTHYSNKQKLKNPESINPQSGLSSQEAVKMNDSDDDDSNMFESEFDRECDEDDALDIKNELDGYYLVRNEDMKNKDFDILTWLKMNASKYLILSEMARDILTI
ncbi:zinc finger BED domain-containing protein RICESLEEPER 1-like [Apium graveolens]|uniref:zinc finger BED domain-containing protein RICESLEEPER 1-like n=1 Tax=Apium graveolens TaxID=4045 RepID=UPI003D7A1333